MGSKSTWTILVMGVVALTIVMIALLAALSGFEQSPASWRLRLAQEIRNKFGFEGARVGVQWEGGVKYLRVAYESRKDSKFDRTRQKQEMEEVAAFAGAQYDQADRRYVREIRIARTEVKASGCWSDAQVSDATFPMPSKEETPYGSPR